MHALLGAVAQAALAREQAVPALRALAAATSTTRTRRSPLAFVLGRPVPRRRLAAALPELGVDGAVRSVCWSPRGAASGTPSGPG